MTLMELEMIVRRAVVFRCKKGLLKLNLGAEIEGYGDIYHVAYINEVVENSDEVEVVLFLGRP